METGRVIQQKLTILREINRSADENGYVDATKFLRKNYPSIAFNLSGFCKRNDFLQTIECFKEVNDKDPVLSKRGKGGSTLFHKDFLVMAVSIEDKGLFSVLMRSECFDWGTTETDLEFSDYENKKIIEGKNIKNVHTHENFENKKVNVYLINLYGKRYKIGHSVNVEKRLGTFKCTNPEARIVGTFESTIKREKQIHSKKTNKRIGETEVFEFRSDEEALEFFNRFNKGEDWDHLKQIIEKM